MIEVRRQGNFEQSVKFFLLALFKVATDAIETIDSFIALHDENVHVLQSLGKTSKNATSLLAYLEKNPIIEIVKTSEAFGLAYNTVAKG